MVDFIPVDHDPFPGIRFVPVDRDPFAGALNPIDETASMPRTNPIYKVVTGLAGQVSAYRND